MTLLHPFLPLSTFRLHRNHCTLLSHNSTSFNSFAIPSPDLSRHAVQSKCVRDLVQAEAEATATDTAAVPEENEDSKAKTKQKSQQDLGSEEQQVESARTQQPWRKSSKLQQAVVAKTAEPQSKCVRDLVQAEAEATATDTAAVPEENEDSKAKTKQKSQQDLGSEEQQVESARTQQPWRKSSKLQQAVVAKTAEPQIVRVEEARVRDVWRKVDAGKFSRAGGQRASEGSGQSSSKEPYRRRLLESGLATGRSVERDELFEADAVQSSSANGGVYQMVEAAVVTTTARNVNGGEGEAAGSGKPYQRLTINLDLELYRARILRQKGAYDQAATLLQQCIRDWPDNGRPYVALGTCLKKMNKVQEARRVFEDGCQAARGENAYIWQAWAVLEDKIGNSSKARKLFDAATVADKTQASAWHGWAVLELREGNTKKARALLKKGIRFSGPNEYLLQTLALMEVKAGKYEQARSLFNKATRANPKSAASWLAWARMEASQDCKTTARNLFKSGVEASPKNRYVWQAWALFEAKEGNEERARQLFQRGQELNPKDPVLFQSYGLFEYNCGHLAIAQALFKRGIAVAPQHQPLWIGWAWVECKEGKVDVARELFQRAISVDSRTSDAVRAFQAWGILEDREGNVGVARVLFKRALQIDSQNVPTWMSWAAMEERIGNAVRADELRNLCLQQRTEIVDEEPWDVNLNSMLAPAIDKIKDFLKLEQRFPWSRSEGEEVPKTEPGIAEVFEAKRLNQEFDVDGFLSDKFPARYGDLSRQQEKQGSKVAIRRQQTLTDNAISSRTF